MFLLCTLLGVAYGSTIVPMTATYIPVTAVVGCTHEGKVYAIGEEVQPDPCTHCYCSDSGFMACAIADCFYSPCVDSVQDPDQCCPVCPNGKCPTHFL